MNNTSPYDSNESAAKVTVPVVGMDCASCAMTIEKLIKKTDGVKNCEVNYGTEKAKIEYDPSKVSLEQLSSKIEPLGYSLAQNASTNSHNHSSTANSSHKEHTEMNSDNHAAMSHTMPDGSVMKNSEHKGMDHSEHLGLYQTKEQKIQELNKMKSKLDFVLPVTFFIFIAMMWEIGSKIFEQIPPFIIPMDFYKSVSFILASVVLFWAGQIFLNGVMVFLKHRVANMDTLVGIGTLTAYIYSSIGLLFPQVAESLRLPEESYYDVTIVVIGFILLGKYLEARAKLRTGEAIEKLLNLQAKTALVERDGEEKEIPVDQVVAGDIVIVKPGSKIPVDGEIIEGKSSIDESMVTGEPIPIDKSTGDKVIGSTINKQGSFKFKATKVGSETLLAHIIKMVEEAQGSRAPIQKLADQISAIFVPIVLVLAFITLIVWLAIGSQFMPFDNALTIALVSFVGILVIACPCALGLATPTSIIVGVGKGAMNGILIKNAESLEKLHKVKVIVADKTGTITKGKPEVTDIILNPASSVKSETEALQIIASLEKRSEHPLAEAILNKAKAEKIELSSVEDFEIIEGKGLKGKMDGTNYWAGNVKLVNDNQHSLEDLHIDDLAKQGKTPVVLMSKEEVIAVIAIADTLKDDAKNAVANLHKMGIKMVMLTGDNKNTARYIADQVGIDEVIAEVLPGQKAEVIEKLQNELGTKGVVAMAGDGVNDAPALAKADVGIAMGTGTDVAIESADITLLHGDITKIAHAVKLSKMTMATIKQNLFWAFIYNIIGIPVAAGLLYPFWGILLNPAFAGAAMAFSSVSVVANSLRLKLKRL